MKINLPFLPEFEAALLTAKKRATTRTRRHGYYGDVFEAFGRYYMITDVKRIQLNCVSAYHYLEEGFNSPQDFIKCWNKIHRRLPFEARPDRKVYLHIFESQLTMCQFHVHEFTNLDGSCRICGCILSQELEMLSKNGSKEPY